MNIKKISYLLIPFLVFGVAQARGQAQTSCVSAPTKIISWIPAEGDARDIVSGHAGILVNGASFGSGIVGQAFSIPQSGYVSFPHDDIWGFGTKDFTIECWAKFNSYQVSGNDLAPDAIFAGMDDGNGGNNKWLFAMHNGKLGFHINNSLNENASAGLWFDSPFIPNANQWYHLAIVRNGDFFTIYTNGNIASCNQKNVLVPDGREGLTIGNMPSEPQGYPFDGSLDELTIYGRALCSSEIQAIYMAGSSGKCSPASPVPVPSGLSAWWPGDDNAKDLVGGEVGITYGGVSYSCDGYVGPSFVFDGVSGYVEVPNSSRCNFVGPFTVETWIKYTQLTGGAGICIVAKGADAEAPIDWALNVSSAQKLRPHVKINNNWVNFDCNTTLIPNTWYHVAMVYDGNTLAGYVNGQLDGSATATGIVASTVNSLRIGAYAPINGSASKCFFSGQIDELSLYKRALSSSEIQSIYNAGKTGKDVQLTLAAVTGLVAWWTGNLCDVYYGNGNPTPDYGTIANGFYTAYTDIISGRTLQSQPQGSTAVANVSSFADEAFSLTGENYLSVNDDPDLNPSKAMTVECWINRQAVVGSWDPIIKKAGDSNGGQTGGYTLELSGNQVAFYVYNGNWSGCTSSQAIETNAWYHIAGVYDGNQVTIYVNGSPSGTYFTSGPIMPSANPLQIGHDPSNNNRFFNGLIDEATIYCRALTADEVEQIYKSGSNGKQYRSFPH